MLNYIYQLVNPGAFLVKYGDEDINDNVVVRPCYMALCHADQRYYMGNRDVNVLNKKLPMALIHECCGEVLFDNTGTYKKGQKVVLIPNVPPSTITEGVYENYSKGSRFLSSGYDGFMREVVCMSPDRMVAFNNIDMKVAAICEFVSVAIHSIDRFIKAEEGRAGRIGVWGDGSLSYVVCCCLKKLIPKCEVYVIGKSSNKLSQFMFVHGSYTANDIPDNFEVDHAFECAGGEGSYYAIEDIIKYINPQGKVMLLGVSENKISINTRDILEKGLTFIGSSRSGRENFRKAVELMEDTYFQQRLMNIITQDEDVCSVGDIHRVFNTDLNTQFKTVFKWNL